MRRGKSFGNAPRRDQAFGYRGEKGVQKASQIFAKKMEEKAEWTQGKKSGIRRSHLFGT